MTCVTVTYIFFAPEGFGALTDALWGLRIGYEVSLAIGVAVSGWMLVLFARFLRLRRQESGLKLSQD